MPVSAAVRGRPTAIGPSRETAESTEQAAVAGSRFESSAPGTRDKSGGGCIFEDSKRQETIEAAVKKPEAGLAVSETFDNHIAKAISEIGKELRTMIGNAGKATGAPGKTLADLHARMKTLEGQVAKLGKKQDRPGRADGSPPQRSCFQVREVSDKRQSLIQPMNRFSGAVEKPIPALCKADEDLVGTVKRLAQRVATLGSDMKKGRNWPSGGGGVLEAQFGARPPTPG